MDPAVRIDTLGNGLVTYVRHNDEPSGRAVLQLAINAGSAVEDDDQRGLAHFVEHMLFNGTRHFEEGALVDFFERVGMRFGPDLNAYTSFDETVYRLELPDDSTILKTGVDVLVDWAAHATLDGDAIERERGVIYEEWRRGLGAAGRVRDKVLPILLRGSRYRDRLPIGDTLTILRAPPEALRRYYRDWYRTDLMAVVAVGDFDEDSLVTRIHDQFGKLRSAENPRPLPTFTEPAQADPHFQVVVDPEFPYTQLEIYFSRTGEPVQTAEEFRTELAHLLVSGMLNARFAEIARDGTTAPFLWARFTKGSFARNAAYWSLAAQVEEDGILAGLDALVTETARAARHGFTHSELQRRKRRVLRAYEQSWRERDNRNSSALASAYVRHFLTGAVAPAIETTYQLANEFIADISLEEINSLAAGLLTEANRVVVLTMPEKRDLAAPHSDDLAQTLAEVATRTITPYIDAANNEPLMANIPEPVDVVDEREVSEVGVTEFTLSNGIRVVVKPTDFRQDEVVFTAFSPGGASLASDEDYFTATVADLIVAKSGVGAFDRTQLTRKLAGKLATVTPSIGEYAEGLSGRASSDDLETLFQLIHLYVTAPRIDSTAVESFRNQQRALILNRNATPGSAFQDSLTAAFFGNWARRQPASIFDLDSLDPDLALALYRDRFADMGDFTFIFVGNFSLDTLRTLSARYLGTLPATAREESWRDLEPDAPTGTVVKTAF